MSDEARVKIVRWICVTVLLFGTFIWPTPFTYVHAGRVVYMVLRFTGWHWFVCFGPS